jgi:hypothetical protein
MDLVPLFLICLGVFSLLRFRILPDLDRRFNARRSFTKIAKAGSIAALRSAADFAFAAVVVYGGIWIFIALSSFRSGADPRTFASAIVYLQSLSAAFGAVSHVWAKVVFGFVIVALAYFHYRGRKTSLDAALRGQLNDEVRRASQEIESERQTGHVRKPNEEMNRVREQIEKLTELLNHTEAEADRQKIYSVRGALAQQYALVDIERRLQVQLPLDSRWGEGGSWPGGESSSGEGSWPKGGSWKDKLRKAVFNAGVFHDLRSVPKLAGRLGNVVLLVSLVGFNAAAIQSGARGRILRLSELQVRATKADIERELQNLQSEPGVSQSKPSPLRPEDQQAIDTLSAHFERAFADSRAWNIPSHAPAAQRASVRENLIREEILRNSSAGPPVEAASGVPAEAASGLEAAIGADGPSTRTGERFRDDLRKFYERTSHAMRDRVNAKVRSYSQPIDAMDAEKWIFDQAFGMAYDGAFEGQRGFAAQAASDIAKSFGEDGVQTAYQIFRDQAFSGLVGPDGLASVFADIREGKGARSYATPLQAEFVREEISRGPTTENLYKKFAQAPPTLPSDSNLPPNAIADLKELNESRAGDPVVDAAIDYNDIAPGHLGADIESPRGRLLAQLHGGGDGSVASLPNAPPFPDAGPSPAGGGGGSGGGFAGGISEDFAVRSRAQFEIGRSFSMLRGSFRVGGVLIGQEPQGPILNKDMNFKDITWTESSAGLDVSVIRGDGRAFPVGSFRKSMINQALAYAADGRPLTVTMASAAPLLELKILVHPALRDSPLGCRAIEIDRYVDEFTSEDAQRKSEIERIAAQTEAYEFAWYTRQSARGIQQSATARTRADDPDLRKGVGQALAGKDSFADPKRSLLAAKPEFFDPELVGQMAKCQVGVAQPAQFEKCLRQEVQSSNRSEAWSGDVPEFQIWSGVRELPYHTDPELRFLKPVSGTPLWPFEFLMQVAFTSEPKFWTGGDPRAYADQHPFEFPTLKPSIQREVAAALATHAEERAHFEDMRDFTTLQRMFRVALAGALGPDFPMQKLALLARETRGAVAKTHTLRWNYRPGLVEARFGAQLRVFSGALSAAGDLTGAPLLKAVQTQAGSCLSTIEKNASMLDRIPAAEWDANCGLRALSAQAALDCPTGDADNPACFVKSLTDVAAEVARVRQLRSALGIPQEEELAQTQRGCPGL